MWMWEFLKGKHPHMKGCGDLSASPLARAHFRHFPGEPTLQQSGSFAAIFIVSHSGLLVCWLFFGSVFCGSL